MKEFAPIHADGIVYTPFVSTEDGRVGYRVTTTDGTLETFIYLNPSAEGGKDANVFVYEGIENDPIYDESVVFVAPEALIKSREVSAS